MPDPAPSPPTSPARIEIMRGPDVVEGFALEAIEQDDFYVSNTSDRTGTRLDGPSLSVTGALARPSAPMVLGAIELTPTGLIVLGPDHPTTGGYPVVAVVRSTSLDALFSRPIGAAVRLVLSARC
jgi:allophanate hydrolase subunit 2